MFFLRCESDDFVALEAFLNEVDDKIQYSIYTYGTPPSLDQIESELFLDAETTNDHWQICMDLVRNILSDF